jgi:membrane fusion protein (multidrug efflux system)
MQLLIKRAAFGLAFTAGLASVGFYGNRYWRVGRFLESTDDAYVQADYTAIAPKVSGYIAEVPVEDNQAVMAGQVLARIDDRDFKTALEQAKADVANAKADIRNLDAQLTLQNAVIAQAAASIGADQAAVTFAQQDFERYHALVGSGAATVQRTEQADADYREKTALVKRDQASLLAAEEQVEVLKAGRAKADARLKRDEAAERQAELNLGYTTIVSPIHGTIGARTLRIGQYVQAGTQLMAVVPLKAIYVVANFKETQLTHVRSGQPATVQVDAFPGVTLEGHVDSLAPASGLEFALLPPDNATGNFTKIVQRIPVKIALDPNTALMGLLRPGMSVESAIDTKATVLAEREGSSLAQTGDGRRLAAR